uniref:Uncharacterized protein n=1 Tax=Arundo donax TaxID=35708 RepID=A0A0A9G9U1_ARUDO
MSRKQGNLYMGWIMVRQEHFCDQEKWQSTAALTLFGMWLSKSTFLIFKCIKVCLKHILKT